jgi:hypothetical protein
MLINETSKRAIYFRPHNTRKVGEGYYYLDHRGRKPLGGSPCSPSGR